MKNDTHINNILEKIIYIIINIINSIIMQDL